jgi:hypothetical protein
MAKINKSSTKFKSLELKKSLVSGFIVYPCKKGIGFPFVSVGGTSNDSANVEDPEEILKLALWLLKAAAYLKQYQEVKADDRD